MFFQFISLFVLLIFYGCYFLKMFFQKRKGIKTDQIGKGKKGFIKIIEITMKIITILVPVAEIVSILLNISKLPVSARYAGVAIALIGTAIFICSVITMRDSWRAGVSATDKTELVTAGIYKISRNPAFLGFDLVYIGILMMFFNWALFLISALAILIFHLQIVNVEEEHLMSVFGNDYLNYKGAVNRYLGRKCRR